MNMSSDKLSDSQQMTLEELQQIAARHGGRLLSRFYNNPDVKLTWTCQQGHIWETTPAQIRQGKWCPVCGRASKKK
jgi:rubrerythrin